MCEVRSVCPSVNFSPQDHVVYPCHGIGVIKEIESKEISGKSIEFFVISFPEERMMLRVPVDKAQDSGLRLLYSVQKLQEALQILKGRARHRQKIWIKRSQEFETKINSGMLESLAEVIRDLHTLKEALSYSERKIYDTARQRLLQEMMLVKNLKQGEAEVALDTLLEVSR